MSCAAMPKGFLNEKSPERNGNPMRMNILATSPNPQTCARNLDNISLQEQIVVVSMLLSKYAAECTYRLNDLHKKVDTHDPFMRWLWNDDANLDWLKEYGILLHCEYAQRFERKHQGTKDIFGFIDDFAPPIGLDPKAFLNRAMDKHIDFHTDPDVHRAYRNYMCARWNMAIRKPTWSGKREPPFWYIEYLTAFNKPLLGETNGEKVVSFTVTGGAGGRGRISYKEGLSGGCEVH